MFRNVRASVRRAIRVFQGEDIWQGVQQNCNKIILGNRNAAWCLFPDALTSESIIYCAGVGEDISFDLELVRRFGAQVHAFDPTPRAIQWLQAQSLPPEFIFHPYGLAGFDGTCKFTPPRNPAHVSHTILKRDIGTAEIDVPVRRVTTIARMLGHSDIDILKMDIEGAEYAVIDDLLSCSLRPKQLLVEFHHRWAEIGVKQTRWAIHNLCAAGYRIFDVSASGEEYSFRLIA